MPEPFECTPSTKIAAAALCVLGLLIFIISMIAGSAHNIEEGHVGIYFVQGALSDETSIPGRHYSIPFVTEVEEIATRPITSNLNDIRTITRDGIVNTFKACGL